MEISTRTYIIYIYIVRFRIAGCFPPTCAIIVHFRCRSSSQGFDHNVGALSPAASIPATRPGFSIRIGMGSKGKAPAHGTPARPTVVASRPPRDGDAAPKVKPVKPLVWMNFSDPLEQSKDKENKKTVKKTAMLNRSRQTW